MSRARPRRSFLVALYGETFKVGRGNVLLSALRRKETVHGRIGAEVAGTGADSGAVDGFSPNGLEAVRRGRLDREGSQLRAGATDG